MAKNYSRGQVLAKYKAIREIAGKMESALLSPDARTMWAEVLEREHRLFERMLLDVLPPEPINPPHGV